jgi:glycosyltransferase involved in cell wall biosynthesis
MRPDEITPLILTYNEQDNIGRALQRLLWAPRVVIIDSGSTDDTLEIVRAFHNVEVLTRAFDSHVTQWNFGLDQIRTRWALSLDADYMVPPAFVREVRDLPESSPQTGFSASFKYVIAGRPLRASLYPPRTVLFRPDSARYEADGHTQLLHLRGPLGVLRTPLLHDDRKPLRAWLGSQERYTALEVAKLSGSGPFRFTDRIRRTKVLAPVLAPLYCLLGKGLLFDGWRGWYYALQRAYAEVLLSVALLDHELSIRVARNEHRVASVDQLGKPSTSDGN